MSCPSVCEHRGCSVALAVVPLLAWLASLASADYSREYQAFVDHFPIHRTCLAPLCSIHYGPQRAEFLPSLYDRHDWIVGHQGLGHDGHGIPRRRRGLDPDSVFASPDKVGKVLELSERHFDPRRRGRVLVLSGAPEITASEAFDCGKTGNVSGCMATIARLRAFFSEIFFEGKDRVLEGVRAMPSGLTEMYLRGGAMEQAMAAIAAADVGESKTKSVLAAWGAVWGYIEDIPEGRAANAMKLEAGKSRRAARVWSATSTAQAIGVEVKSVRPQQWWAELAQYRFLLSPLGTSIYSPKTVEALLVLTVPIVQRGPFPVHDELVSYGFPLVVVSSWEEITTTRLEDWWRERSPRLAAFRRNCLTAEAYWRLLTGLERFCA